MPGTLLLPSFFVVFGCVHGDLGDDFLFAPCINPRLLGFFFVLVCIFLLYLFAAWQHFIVRGCVVLESICEMYVSLCFVKKCFKS